MQPYKIKLVSLTNSVVLIVTLMAAFIGGVMVFIPHGDHDPISAWVVVGSCMILAYLLWQRFVTGRTEWTIDEDEIHIVWSKKFMFADCKDIVLKWDQVKNISKGMDTNYYNLKIKLTSGRTIRFYHDNMTTRDDFDQCLTALYQRVQKNQSKK